MRYKILFFCCLLHQALFAQIKQSVIYDSWVVTNITYKDGTELPDDNPLKYTYIKHTFAAPDKLNSASVYYEKGMSFLFEIKGDQLIISSGTGSVLNKVKIEELSDNKLVLLQAGNDGFDDPKSIKYQFKRERDVQNAIRVNTSDVFSVHSGDTVYNQSAKIYARFKGDSFQLFLMSNMPSESMDGRSGKILASFVVSKNGIADSLKILESIDPEYDKAFTRSFNRGKIKWEAAKLNGKNVSVRMTQQIRYLSSEVVSAYSLTQDANAAFKEQNYELALYYFDKSLDILPTDQENLYKRGICKRMLGNQAGACEDWQRIKSLGGIIADTLLAKYCN